MAMELEIKDIIAKNLPAHVGDVLKQRLEQADKDAANLKEALEKVSNLSKELAEAKIQLNKHDTISNRIGELEAYEKAIDLKERNIELDILKRQLAIEKEKTDFTQSIALGLVRNIEYRNTVYHNSSAPFVDGHGYKSTENTSSSKDETKRAQ
jgi:hypothetical protein